MAQLHGQAQIVSAPLLSVLIVNYNSGPHLAACLRSVLLQSDAALEVIVVDNASCDSSLHEARAELTHMTLIQSPRNLGFAAAMNLAAASAQGDWLLALNPDCVLPNGVLRRSLELAQAQPNLGLAGALVCNLDGSQQNGTWRRMPTPWRLLMSQLGLTRWQVRFELLGGVESAPTASKIALVEAVNGAFMLLKRSTFKALDGFDDAYFLHFEDLDLMARIRQTGRDVVLFTGVKIAHAKGTAGASKAAVEWAKARSMRRFFARHCKRQFGARWVPMLAHARVLALLPWWWMVGNRNR